MCFTFFNGLGGWIGAIYTYRGWARGRPAGEDGVRLWLRGIRCFGFRRREDGPAASVAEEEGAGSESIALSEPASERAH